MTSDQVSPALRSPIQQVRKSCNFSDISWALRNIGQNTSTRPTAPSKSASQVDAYKLVKDASAFAVLWRAGCYFQLLIPVATNLERQGTRLGARRSGAAPEPGFQACPAIAR